MTLQHSLSPERYAELIATFHRYCQTEAKRLSRSLDGLRRGDPGAAEAIQAMAHGLVGSSGLLGFTRLSRESHRVDALVSRTDCADPSHRADLADACAKLLTLLAITGDCKGPQAVP